MPDARVSAFFLAAILLGLPSGFAATYRISFQDQLKLPQNLRLFGNAAARTVRFTCESAWKPAAGSALHLFLEHSPSLDPDRSFLSVSLNYGVLRSVRLDEQNERLTEVTIPLPAGQLQLQNDLLFSVEQYAARGDRAQG